MTYDLAFLLSLSVLLPVIAILVRGSTIPASYHPLILIVFAGLTVEIISHFSSSTAILSNIYSLAELILYCILFRNWKYILNKKFSFYGLTAGITMYWVVDNLLLKKITTYDSYFHIIYPFILILLAVNQLNYLIINEKGDIITNSIFILCIALIIFFSYKTMSEIFYHYAPNSDIKKNIFNIQTYVNVVFNILLTLVVICIPKKRTIIPR